MVEEKVIVEAKNGVHARPAAMIVELAMGFVSDVLIVNGPTEANAKSIMEIMMLSAVHGIELTVRAAGDDEQEAVAAMQKLFADKFNEE